VSILELVKLKGTGDGVKIYLSAEEEISLIMHALHDKLDEFRKFFGSGHCNIYIIGRELSLSDKMRIEAVVKAMLPESTVNYGERKFFRSMKKPKEAEPEIDEEKIPEPTIPVEQIKEVVTHNFKSNRARLFEGVVRADKIVESDGHLVLMGNVESGGKLIAVGNIIVMGSIKGEVEAGCMGNHDAYIAALDLSPTKIKIADTVLEPEKYTENEDNSPRKAYLINNEIKIEKFW
jgi:septum site-determining protein MinC